MKTDDALKHFGTLERVAATLEISVSAVSQWGKIIHEKMLTDYKRSQKAIKSTTLAL